MVLQVLLPVPEDPVPTYLLLNLVPFVWRQTAGSCAIVRNGIGKETEVRTPLGPVRLSFDTFCSYNNHCIWDTLRAVSFLVRRSGEEV